MKLALLLLLAACAPLKPDADGDGFAADVDCDDADPDVNPGAEELCGAGDEDCNGAEGDADAPADALTAYADTDGDGFGDPASATPMCALAPGWIAVGEDCDDTDRAVSPDGVEVCDDADVDEDCDGLTDDDDPNVDEDAMTRAWEDSDGDGHGDPGSDGFFCDVPRDYVIDATDCDDADPTVTSASTWYLDSDGDRYGDPTRTETGCEPSPGYVADSADCDDSQATVSPSARELCDGEDDDCDGTTDEADADDAPTWYLDADHDGHGDAVVSVVQCYAPTDYVGDAADCDDTRADVSPSHVEICDATNTDEDCNGLGDDADLGATPDGMASHYADTDADGYGDPDVAMLTCDPAPGYVADGTDCDDTYAGTNPGMTEICDGANFDEDCDGYADDGDSSVDATTLVTWSYDADRDGYGRMTGGTLSRCDEPGGFVSNDDDCDDADAAVSPGATEVCDAADFDEDCDGLSDDADASVDATTYGTFYADTDGDGYGDETSTNASCDETAGFVAEAGDCDIADPAISPGATEICGDSVDDNCDASTNCVLDEDDAARMFYGVTASNGVGTSVTNAGDMNGDGYDDMFMTSIRDATGGGSYAGAGWLVAGGATGDVSLASATATIVGEDSGDMAGYCSAGVGDTNGDGYDDLLVGAVSDDRGGSSAGAGYLVRGPISGTVDLSTAYAIFKGEAASASTGSACSGAGDVDGDGIGDLLIGAYNYSSSRGAAYLVTSVTSGTTALSGVARMYGESSDDSVGWAVDGAGDTNGDGYGDIVLGAYGDDDIGYQSGAAYIVLGPQTGSLTLSGADAKLRGETAGDYAGESVAGIGDMDDDGYDDVLVASAAGATDGIVYLVFGPISGTISLSAADVRIEGTSGGIGGRLQTDAADYDNDGFVDLALGNSGGGATGTEGELYLLRGPLSGSYTDADADLTIRGTEEDAYLGRLAFVNAQDGRPGHDIFVVAPNADYGAEDAGAGYLFSLAGY